MQNVSHRTIVFSKNDFYLCKKRIGIWQDAHYIYDYCLYRIPPYGTLKGVVMYRSPV